jgi:hypothetical protein
MARRPRRRAIPVILFYGIVTIAIMASFAWQMMHGVCPVP